MRSLRAALAAPLVVCALTLSGCSVSVAQSDLEAEVARDEEGVSDVACDGDLEGTIGETQQCTVSFDDDTTLEITLTVTEVDGSDVLFDVEVVEEE